MPGPLLKRWNHSQSSYSCCIYENKESRSSFDWHPQYPTGEEMERILLPRMTVLYRNWMNKCPLTCIVIVCTKVPLLPPLHLFVRFCSAGRCGSLCQWSGGCAKLTGKVETMRGAHWRVEMIGSGFVLQLVQDWLKWSYLDNWNEIEVFNYTQPCHRPPWAIRLGVDSSVGTGGLYIYFYIVLDEMLMKTGFYGH